MWDEIQELNEVVPAQSVNGLNTIDRQSFLTENPKTFARGLLDPTNQNMNLIVKKDYRGPDIKPLMPNYVADQLKYSDA